jgi:hypothetical protein
MSSRSVWNCLGILCLLVGCADPAPDESDASGAGGNLGAGGMGGVGGVGGDDDVRPGDAGGGGVGGTPGGLCLSATDQAGLAADYGGKAVDDLAGECALMCVSEADQETCFLGCMETATAGAVSRECLSCVGVSVQCVQANCLGECLADPGSELCGTCQCGDNPGMVNCRDAFAECAGVAASGCE